MNAGAPCHIADNTILYQLKNFLVRKISGQWESLEFILAQNGMAEFCDDLLRVDQGLMASWSILDSTSISIPISVIC